MIKRVMIKRVMIKRVMMRKAVWLWRGGGSTFSISYNFFVVIW